jgi:phosphoribosylamine--glycine ligase
MAMKVLLVGGGGREHALAWKIAQSSLLPQIYVAPGNAGIEQVAQPVPIAAGDIDALCRFAQQEGVDLTVVGPEAPLAMGIVDRFENLGLSIFGPSQQAALLESSKAFAKDFMVRQKIPTASYRICDSPQEARRFVRRRGAPVVVKADGLASGKGVIVADTVADAELAIERIMESGTFGPAGQRVVVEEFLQGEEASILALVDGQRHLTMIPSQDHKRIGDGDRGANTGGMGAYAPAPVITSTILDLVEKRMLEPAIAGMAQQGHPFKGLLYIGLMIGAVGPKVVEFNCRFGDPEAQVVLPLLEDDLLELMLAVANGDLEGSSPLRFSGAAACVVMASRGYPGEHEKGCEIFGLDLLTDREVLVFHAGTRREGSRVLTDGGRVLGVTGLGDDVAQAVQRAYRAVGQISFRGAYFRTDIARRAVERSPTLRSGGKNRRIDEDSQGVS